MEPITGQQTITDQSQQLNFLGTINAQMDGIEGLKEQVKTAKEKLDAELKQHEQYIAATNEAQSARLTLKGVKDNLLKDPNVAAITEQLNDLKYSLKEKKEILSDVTVQYADKENRDYIDLSNGRMYIKKSAKLVKRK